MSGVISPSEQSPDLPIWFFDANLVGEPHDLDHGLGRGRMLSILAHVKVMVADRQADDLGQTPLRRDHFAQEGMPRQIPLALDLEEGAAGVLRVSARSCPSRSGSIW